MLCSLFAAMGLAMFAGSAAFAQDVRYTSYGDDAAPAAGCCDSGCDSCCDSCCDVCCDEGEGSWIVIGELTFFRYHRADGVRTGTTILGVDDAEFDFEISPRVTIGYQGGDGLGLRARWWDYHHTAAAFGPSIGPNHGITVETYTLDLEVFDTIQLNSVWTAEISAGIRINEFEEVMREFLTYRENDFEGFGGVVGLELKRCIGEGLAVFARVRGAILMDDKNVTNIDLLNAVVNDVVLLDSTQGMMEIALGVEANWDLDYNAVAFARLSGEWQNWYNYSSEFDGVVGEDFFDGPSDVGFGGFVVSLGLAY
jgi:hypothetical protein